jgi:AraC-like DNA-binding protein
MQAPFNHPAAIRYCRHKAASEGNLHLHENTIVFVCEGEYRFEYGEVAFQANAGQAVFLRKNIFVHYRVGASDQEKPAWMQFLIHSATVHQLTTSPDWQISSPEVSEKVLVHQPGPLLMTCIGSLESYLKYNVQLPPHLEKLKLLELLQCLLESAQDEPILQQLLDFRQASRSDMADIARIIENNLMNTLSLCQLARLSGRSLSSFRRDFRALYNMPPSRWVRLRRLEKARELLAATNMTVTDIGYTLGFENIAHFSRLFKARYGLPPSGVRDKNRADGHLQRAAGHLTQTNDHSPLT